MAKEKMGSKIVSLRERKKHRNSSPQPSAAVINRPKVWAKLPSGPSKEGICYKDHSIHKIFLKGGEERLQLWYCNLRGNYSSDPLSDVLYCIQQRSYKRWNGQIPKTIF